ncbi:transglutaminase family protein [Roseomonas sp. OT10]|uniref:transglutaminase-like domain-containing protein n=1 Tax=Roseomonas cutis TaxID=2897332 RepID=UPI001E39DFDC|nr:transglutaminase family protein [Roseomonas sp. OT10]UFN48008.1 transglutaminase family protein [Roseomonas sp. OT10]
MLIRCGYEISYDCWQEVPMVLMLGLVQDRLPDLRSPLQMTFNKEVRAHSYYDGFGNFCTRVVAPPGRFTVSADFLMHDSGLHDPIAADAVQHEVADLPDDVMVYLLGSRYCETDKLTDEAWSLFGHTPLGWARVQAICDHVHNRIRFGYEFARATKTAFEANQEQRGVCRDYTHLAVAFCRCMNIPARYVTGYLGDIGVPPVDYPMDFSAWFEVYLGGRWHTFDARHNTPRIGRILMARGRDATDVAISTAFGRAQLAGFNVITDEVTDEAAALARYNPA